MQKMPNGKTRYVMGHIGSILNTPENRFKLKCSEPDDNGCILWKGYLKPNGYGQFSVDGKPIYPHRYAYEVFYQTKVPRDLCVCHKCNTRHCVNPEHLFLASVKGNMQDMFRKKRNHWAKNPVVTEEQRKEIHIRMKNGEKVSKLKDQYKISDSTCYKIFYQLEGLK